jgi:hypothetical protein
MLTAQEMRERGNTTLVADALKEIENLLEKAEPHERCVRAYFETLGKPLFIHKVVADLEDRHFEVETGPNSHDETYVEVGW